MNDERIAGLARNLLGRGGTLEGGAGAAALTEADLASAIRQQLTGSVDDEGAVLANQIAAGAIRAAQRLQHGDPVSSLSDLEVSHLEAIVMLSGRPALRYPEGRLEMPAPLAENETWRIVIATARKEMERGSASVGQIGVEIPGGPIEPLGTGWRIGDRMIVTNRHVTEQLAANPEAPPDTWTLRPDITPSVDFAAVHKTKGSQRFPLSQIAWCADFQGPDLALLELGATGAPPPGPLKLDWDIDSLGDTVEQSGAPVFRGREIYVVGHPYWTGTSDAVSQVFGKADGKKRCSPGYVTRIRGSGAIFDHDCSTLGGNSGSCVFSVDFHRVVGLHFSGVNTDSGGVGSSNVALSLAQLSGEAEQILRAYV